MVDIVFSILARVDLADIDAYSAENFGDDAADAYARGFNEAFDLLRRHPLAGAEKPELGRGVRCLVHRRHRIFYTVRNDQIFIARIVHHAQDARRALN